jgi:hypothetical protein
MERRRNSPETKAAIARDRAEDRFHARLKKLAKRAIIEFGWSLERWEAKCRDGWEWAHWQWGRDKSKRHPLYQKLLAEKKALRESEDAEIRWKAHLKELDHQEKLRKAREAWTFDKQHGKESAKQWAALQEKAWPGGSNPQVRRDSI